MEEAEDFIAESVFGDRDDNGPILDDENAAPSDEQLLNDLFKKGDKIRVTPKRKVVHPQPKLREQELCGPKGFMALKKMFDNYKPNPRKDPYGNLVDIMNRVEYWAHLLYPKLNFDDFIARVETLGEKRMVKTYMEKMRLNMPLTDEDFTRISKQGVSTFGERDDEMASEPDAGGIITSHPDNDLDDFVDQFYNDPTSMAIASSSKETANARPLELTEAQRQRIAENKRRAEELRAKRDAFLNRLDVQPDKEDASKQRQFIEETSATQHSVPQQPSQTATEPSTSAVTDMMDDDDALNFIFSTD